MVCDESGTVVACSCSLQSCRHLGYQFPRDFLDEAGEKGNAFQNNLQIGCYGDNRMAAVSLVRTKDGGVGYVVSSRSTREVSQRLGEAVRVNVLVVIVVLAFAAPVVSDGHVREEFFSAMGLTRRQLAALLDAQGVAPDDLFLMTVDGQGRVALVRREGKP